MQKYFGLIAIFLVVILVLARTYSLKRKGIEAFEFGQKDKKDFLILPFALFYFYLLIANAFQLPTVGGQELFQSETVSWIGVFACLLAVIFFLWTLISFKESFRVGLVENTEQGLIVTGAFAFSRNPIYVSFALMLAGQFLIFPSWILLTYAFIAVIRFHVQVLKEEKLLKDQYGNELDAYCKKVRRYL